MSAARRRSRTRGPVRLLLVGALIGVVFAFCTLAYRYLNATLEPAPDFEGAGTGSALLHVEPGDSLGKVGDRLYEIGSVKSTRAFTVAAQGTAVEGIQPGYYQVRTSMSAKSVVSALSDPNSRVGFIEIKPGARLLDTEVVGGQREKGIYTLISEASCLRNLDNPNAAPSCKTPEEIIGAAAGADPTSLGVPNWATEVVSKAPDPVRRLDGLIAPGVHNINPNSTPVEMIASLVSSSAMTYDQTQLSAAAQKIGLSPYQLITAASLVEKEGHTGDFDKIARVILNRLAAPMRLQFDSTVNYSLSDQEVATTDGDRERTTPWNTYAMDGLPYGPIGSPGLDALKAMENPAEGRWVYFVTVDRQGTTKFAVDFQEHQRYQQEAIANGVLASGR